MARTPPSRVSARKVLLDLRLASRKGDRAALSLAKLCYAANRDADAHAVLAPAVEGFPPTQQFPELAEAQTLLAALNP